MCKIDLSKIKLDLGLPKTRELVEKSLFRYREQVVSLISKHDTNGIRFGRCFPKDEDIQKMLHDIPGDEKLKLDVRIQALYEILKTDQETPNNLKEKWMDSFLKDHVNFKNMCKRAYLLENKNTEDEYFQELVNIKIPQAKANKKWIYLIELAILYRGDKEIKNIINKQINASVDSFLIHAGEKCLEYLKAE